MTKTYLKRGNHKLPKTTAIFNLPQQITCPGATRNCMKWCYAKKAEIQYKDHVLDSRKANYRMSQTPEFVDTISKEIDKLHKRGSINMIRIHEAGDFFSQAYINKWIEIANKFPGITFYSYTKSTMFDFSKRPSNMIVRLSLDSSSKETVVAKMELFDGIAWTCDKGEDMSSQNGFICPMSCKECDYCGTTRDNVIFKKH